MKLDSEKRARLAKLIRLLGSDNAGEVAAAAHKLQEVLRSSGADLHDLAALLEDEQIAAIQDRADQAGWTHDAPGPPPSSPAPRRRPRSFVSDGKLQVMAACLVAVVAIAAAGLVMRGTGEPGPQRVGTATDAPAPSKLVSAAPSPVKVKQGPPPPPAAQARSDAAPPTPVKFGESPPSSMQKTGDAAPPAPAQAKPDTLPPPSVQVRQDSPPQTVEVLQDPPKLSSAPPKAKPVVARAEPPPGEPSEARSAARSAVGEIIRQIRFPQRIDREITMVSVSAYGSQIVASYRSALPANEMGGQGALRRLAVETACGLPSIMSALNSGATHRARYTDPDGAVTEVVVAARDCDD